MARAGISNHRVSSWESFTQKQWDSIIVSPERDFQKASNEISKYFGKYNHLSAYNPSGISEVRPFMSLCFMQISLLQRFSKAFKRLISKHEKMRTNSALNRTKRKGNSWFN